MKYPNISGPWTPLHDALYYPLSRYLVARRVFSGRMRSEPRKQAMAIIAQIKGRLA